MRTYFGFSLLSIIIFFVWLFNVQSTPENKFNIEKSENKIKDIDPTTPPDTGLPFPLPKDDPTEFFPPQTQPIHLSYPTIIKDTIIYDPINNEYVFYRKIGDFLYRLPQTLSFEEYHEKNFDKIIQDYWQERNNNATTTEGRTGIPTISVPGNLFPGIFGSSTIDIRPQGTAELIFGVAANRRDDPALNVRQQRNANFNFEERIQMNMMAKVGEKINFNVKYNTEATFEFENEMKLKYEGQEDEIIKLIEAGNVTLPLNSTLITGSQSLFGIKSKKQFGKTNVTSVISQQKGERSTITVDGGAQKSEFQLTALDYEANRHFFIAQYFHENYDKFLNKLPIISSPINITKIEVWVTNIGPATTENRNIVAFMDLGENKPHNPLIGASFQPYANFPQNRSNDIFMQLPPENIRDLNSIISSINSSGLGMTSGIDFEKVENARLLQPTEFTYNSKLGFISLNSQLNPDQVLAVAFQYTIVGIDSVFQVGEFSTGGVAAPQTLAVKLLKSTATNTKIPLWNLMMKNVYAIGGFRINSEDFQLHITYKNNETGIPMGYITESIISGIPLIRILNMDNLNVMNDPEPDGIFDFIDNAATQGGTIQSQNGRVFFPVTEPFGSYLRKKINDMAIADKYCFDSLYTMTKTEARQYPNKNRFLIQGYFKSEVGSEISLNAMNVPQGSVKVTAGGIPLTENVDFTVDYTLGRVKIINEGILHSGTPIQISLESQALFAIQTKTLLGTHIDHQLLPNLNLGLTVMNLTERPLTTKVNFGDEPISNTIWGFQVSHQTELPLLTKVLDLLPFYSTKTPSSINFNGEFAHLIPGHSRAIGTEGTAYIDDFEGSKSSINLKNIGRWFISGAPKGQPTWFPEAINDSTNAYGFNRALLSFYVIDPLFYRNNNLTPQHIRDDEAQLSNHYVREILETEVFPFKENPQGLPLNIPMLNLTFYPRERGPYNYDVEVTPISAGVDANGFLNDPATRWAGMMRSLETTDFEETNVEYIEFWLLDPFIYEPYHSGGYLVFNLGDISEDILHDNRKFFENGLPTTSEITNVDTTQWGRVPTIQSIVNAFDNNPVSRQYQDVGYDGLSDEDENSFFSDNYLAQIIALHGNASVAYSLALSDPSSDNFRFFRGQDFDSQEASILERYKYFNSTDGNSPTSEQSEENYPTSSTTIPNVEDINRDNTLTSTERYYQYIIRLRPEEMIVGKNYITDYFDASPLLRDGTTETVRWYQFKIPVKSPDQVVGNIQDFKSIRFMRIFLRGFSDTITLRFATLNLVRSQWRRYDYSLLSPGEYIPDEEHNETTFQISAVNIEENGNRTPIPYVLPPGIEREVNWGTTNLQQMNEQSLTMKVCHLVDGDARAIYKTTDFDFRRYKHLKMHVHAQELNSDNYIFNPGDLSLFIRLGTDFTDNYYEYEIPLRAVPPNVGFDRYAIWPADQKLNLYIQKFVELKKRRNLAMRQPNSTITLGTIFTEADGSNYISVIGTPNLSDVKTIMIGVRNPKRMSLTDKDDGLPKCAEIWINELRLTDFDEKGGWGATARISANLADLGSISIAGLHSTAGFGSIEQKVNERSMENITTYDISTNLELGKFFPEKAGIRIPMHYDISETFNNPQYNPLSPDILLKDDVNMLETREEKDSLLAIVQDYTKRKSINFMNVSKIRTGDRVEKVRLYDIENFDFSYAYTELYNRNIDLEYKRRKTNKLGLGYTFQKNPKNFRPFSKSNFLSRHKFLALIRDFNFFLSPRALSFRSEMDRHYQEQLMRNKTDAVIILEPNLMKTFNWTRFYNMKFDLTQSLKLDFTANAISRIDESPGRVSKDDPNYQAYIDSVWTNIKDFGRLTQYTHNYSISYNVPINKIPLFNWINVTTEYSGDFMWTASPLYRDTLGNFIDHPFGNTIENNRTMSVNVNANMTNLYNKINYLKKLNQPPRPQQQRQPLPIADDDSAEVVEPEEERINYPKLILDNTLRLLMSLKNVSASYTRSEGNMLPGFMSTPTHLGMDWKTNAPGLGYVFGSQADIRGDMADLGILSTDSMFNMTHASRFNENLNVRLTLEPIRTFRIEVSATRTYSLAKMDYFRWDPTYEEFRSFSPTENGNFSISIITWNTAFIADADDFSNANFAKFKAIRPQIAQKIAQQNPHWDGSFTPDELDNNTLYPTGYNSTSQDVLITAFLSAYTGSDVGKYVSNTFPQIPLPNWRINYTGLSRIEFFKQFFKSVTLMHSYRSTYSVGTFNSNINFNDPEGDGFTWVRDQIGNNLSRYEIGIVSINEQFSPLLNLDLKWIHGMTNRIEFKKSRNLSLGLANHQLTEITSNEFIFGFGYIFREVPFTINTAGGRRTFESDLNVKIDFSIRNNKTILRKVTEQYDQISAGQKVITINASADYQLSERFTIRLFFDRIINRPHITSQLDNSNTNAGISVRFSLAA